MEEEEEEDEEEALCFSRKGGERVCRGRDGRAQERRVPSVMGVVLLRKKGRGRSA